MRHVNVRERKVMRTMVKESVGGGQLIWTRERERERQIRSIRYLDGKRSDDTHFP